MHDTSMYSIHSKLSVLVSSDDILLVQNLRETSWCTICFLDETAYTAFSPDHGIYLFTHNVIIQAFSIRCVRRGT